MSALTPLTILITGATDGMGRHLATQLAEHGHCLLIHGRNPAKGSALLDELLTKGAHPNSRYYNADLGSLAAIKKMTAELLAGQHRLDVLVNNAGIGPRKPGSARQLSADGLELMFAVNYLAGFILSRALLPVLRKSAVSRIINVASIGQQALDFDDLMLEHDYDDARAYRQSKLAQILDTFTLAAALEGSGITVNCLHPATLMNTKMVYDSDYFPTTMTTVEQGAAALMRLILDPSLEQLSGRYFDGQEPASANAQAYDIQARMKLLAASEQLAAAASR